MLIVAITTVILATADLAVGVTSLQQRRELAMKAKYAFDGAAQEVRARRAAGAWPMDSSQTIDLNGLTIEASIKNNTATIKHTLSLDVKTTVGPYTYWDNRVVPDATLWSPIFYALAIDGDQDINGNLILGSGVGRRDGDLYVNGQLSRILLGQLEVHGDAEICSSGGYSPITDGSLIKRAPAENIISADRTKYRAAAAVTAAPGLMNGYTFPPPIAGSYPIIYVSGDLIFKGALSGRGLFYVKGSLSIVGDVTYKNTDSVAVFITEGDVNVSLLSDHVAGFFYLPNSKFNIDSKFSPLELTGGIVAKSLGYLRTTTIVSDPYFWDDWSRLTPMHIPGTW